MIDSSLGFLNCVPVMFYISYVKIYTDRFLPYQSLSFGPLVLVMWCKVRALFTENHNRKEKYPTNLKYN